LRWRWLRQARLACRLNDFCVALNRFFHESHLSAAPLAAAPADSRVPWSIPRRPDAVVIQPSSPRNRTIIVAP
jgi:hypothetical protein